MSIRMAPRSISAHTSTGVRARNSADRSRDTDQSCPIRSVANPLGDVLHDLQWVQRLIGSTESKLPLVTANLPHVDQIPSLCVLPGDRHPGRSVIDYYVQLFV